jgi:hypothetical protein
LGAKELDVLAKYIRKAYYDVMPSVHHKKIHRLYLFSALCTDIHGCFDVCFAKNSMFSVTETDYNGSRKSQFFHFVFLYELGVDE